MHDVFEPRNEPARSIYLAFKAEATKREGRKLDEWVGAERKAVFDACAVQAAALGVCAPDMQQVMSAERYAMGSADYGAKWAYQLAHRMRKMPL